jgi:hypothetical protein
MCSSCNKKFVLLPPELFEENVDVETSFAIQEVHLIKTKKSVSACHDKVIF